MNPEELKFEAECGPDLAGDEQALVVGVEGFEGPLDLVLTLARQCQERLDQAELKITKLKESFAPLPERTNGAQLRDEAPDYEYIAEDDANDDEPFA